MAIEGLAQILKFKADQAAKEEARNRPKAEYLSSVFPGNKKNNSGLGDAFVGQFVQELDKGSANYDPEKGLGLLLKEHQPPGRDGFKRRADCTDPESEDPTECYACDVKRADYVKDAPEGNWKTQTFLYINFATLIDGEPKVFVLSRNANSGFFDQILQEIKDEGSLLTTSYRITKSGSGTTTNWSLKGVKDPMFDISNLEPFDIKETVQRSIPLEDQAAYYGAVYSGRGNTAGAATESKAAKADDDNDAW